MRDRPGIEEDDLVAAPAEGDRGGHAEDPAAHHSTALLARAIALI
jgi:hypothetical protein